MKKLSLVNLVLKICVGTLLSFPLIAFSDPVSVNIKNEQRQIVISDHSVQMQVTLNTVANQKATINPPSPSAHGWTPNQTVNLDENESQTYLHAAIQVDELPSDIFTTTLTGSATFGGGVGVGGGGDNTFIYFLLGGKYGIHPEESIILLGYSQKLEAYKYIDGGDGSDISLANMESWSASPTDDVIFSAENNGIALAEGYNPLSTVWFRAYTEGKYVINAVPVGGSQSDVVNAVVNVQPVMLKSIDFLGVGNHILKKQGADDWSNDKFVDDGNVIINYPEWQDENLDGTPEKEEPVCYTGGSLPKMNVVLSFSQNITSDVSAKLRARLGNLTNVIVEKEITLSGTEVSVNNLEWNNALTKDVFNMDTPLTWEISYNGGSSYISISTSNTKFFITHGLPQGTLTAKRADWATDVAYSASTISDAAWYFADSLANDPGFTVPKTWELDSWKFLDMNTSGDCITLAKLACEGLKIIGIPSQYRWAFPTADGSAGFPAVTGNTCRNKTIKQFSHNGEMFNAKLIYPGNNFEAFFTVSDPDIKAYTVYPPDGPFENQTYYYLEVLKSVTTDQFWVWDGTQTKNGVTVIKGQDVPGEPHITVPAVPANP